jgi:hypothetical protein
VWWQPEKGDPYRRLDRADAAALRAQFETRGRAAVLEAV